LARHQGLTVEQRVKVERWAEGRLLVRAAVCRVHGMSPIAALRFNERLAVGALTFTDNFCFLRATLPLATLGEHDLVETIAYVAREACRLANPRVVEPSAAAFAGYED
jgi:hypothetical protein